MYYKLDGRDFNLLREIERRTFTDYEILGNFIPVDSFISIIEDLVTEIELLEEKVEDLKEDMEQNYKPISVSEQYGISNKDFVEML